MSFPTRSIRCRRDFNDKLTGITYPNSSTNTFVTDDLGHRVSKTDSAGTSSYLYDGSRVLADSRADYTNGGVTGVISERAGSTSKVYHGDQLGSTRGLTNGSETVTDSREYDAWGLTIAAAGTGTPLGFVGGQGYQTDPDSGLMLLGARYYDPSVGRFINRDPVRFSGGLNLYAYCDNSPISKSDPTGLWAIGINLGYVVAFGLPADRAGVCAVGDVWLQVEIGGNGGIHAGYDYGVGEGFGVLGSIGGGIQVDTSNLTDSNGDSVRDFTGELGTGGMGVGYGAGGTFSGTGPVDGPPTSFVLSWLGPTGLLGAWKAETHSGSKLLPTFKEMFVDNPSTDRGFIEETALYGP